MQALWMLLAAALLASMSVCVKFASAYFHASELVFFRGLINLCFVAAFARYVGTSLKTSIPAIPANNPSHFYYKELLQKFGIVKIELLKSNPFELDLSGLTKVLGHDAGFAELVGEGLGN
jgi:hypothetical protein